MTRADRADLFDGGRNAGEEPTTAARDEDDVHVRQILHQLQANRALTRYDVRIVEGVDEREVALALQCEARLEEVCLGQHDLAAVTPRRIDLALLRRARHDDRGLGCRAIVAPQAERLGVISRREGDHAASARLLIERGELVQHTARLERAGLLKELELERDARCRAAGSDTWN